MALVVAICGIEISERDREKARVEKGFGFLYTNKIGKKRRPKFLEVSRSS